MFNKQSFGFRATTKGYDRIVWMRSSFLLLTLMAGALAALYFSRQAAAANITWNGLGGDNNWSTGANWVGGVAPTGSGDLAIFDGTSTKNATIDIDVNIGSIEIDSGYTGAITQAAGKNIALSTQSACAGAAGFCQNGGTFTLTSGSIMVQGNYNQSGGAFNVGNDVFTEVNNFEPTGGSFNGGTGTINMQARLELNGTAQFTSTTGTLTINGDFKDDVAGTAFNHNNGTVTFTGPFFGSTLPIGVKPTTGETFNNLNFNLDNGKGCSISGGPLVVQGGLGLALNDGFINNGTLQVPVPVPVTVKPEFDGGTSTLLLTGAMPTRTLTFDTAYHLLNVDLNSSGTTINTSGSGTLTFPSLTLEAGIINQGGADIIINGNYNQTGGTFNGSSNQFTEISNFNQSGGAFNGGAGDIQIGTVAASEFALTGSANFKSTTGALILNGQFLEKTDTVTFTHNNGTVTFTGPLFFNPASIQLKTGGETFNHVNFNGTDGRGWNLTGPSGALGTMNSQGNLALNDGFIVNGALGPQGNIFIASTFDDGSSFGGPTSVTFSGGVNQTFTNNGGANPTGPWTINKSNGRLTLLSDLTLQSGQHLDITSGTLDQGGSFNLTAGPITIGSAGGSVGRFTNQGTGDLMLGGTLTVNSGGTITLNGGGGGCTDADSILIRSSVNGTQRTWSGSGNFFLTDVDVKDQIAGTPPANINVFSSTDSGNNTGFSFLSGCGPTAAESTISGRVTLSYGSPLGGAVVHLNGATSQTTISDAMGNYRFPNLQTGNFYNVTPSLANYQFTPASRSISLVGNTTDAGFTGNSEATQTANAIDTTEFFVRQQYLDFLGREPDQDGFAYWCDQINRCNGNVNCFRARRIDVSAAFFASPEFQQTGSFIYALYAGALGRTPNYHEFMPDRSLVVGGPNLAASKVSFADAFVQRPEFIAKYPQSLTRDQFVDALLRTIQERAGVDMSSQRDGLLTDYDNGGRALVVRHASEAGAFVAAEYNKAFVLMEYFGYLRRNVDQGGYDFWLDVLNGSSNNFRGMVCAFLTSNEYQRRFGSVITHSNAECGP